MSYYSTPQYIALREFWGECDVHDEEAFGLKIHLHRNWSKAWCGYVSVPPSHPFFGKDYSDRVPAVRDEIMYKQQSPIALLIEASKEDDGRVSIDILLDCPGGITYAGIDCWNKTPDGDWWFGFDCSHYNDLTPQQVFQSFSGYPFNLGEGTYRTFKWVLEQTQNLARQLSEVQK